MLLRFCAALLLTMAWSCSGDDDQAPKEPVATEAPAKVPDSPGDAGQTTEKPAGEGQAAETPPAVEKSTAPAVEPVKETAAPAAAGDMVVKAGALNVRSGAGMKNAVVRVLKKGEKVSPQSCDKGWCKLAEGEFVSKKYLGAAK